MYVWGFFGGSLSSHSRVFHSYGYVTTVGEGLQISTYARNLWQLSSEGSLTCHTHCDTGLPFIMVISKDPWNSHLLPSVWQRSCHYLFLRLRSVATGVRTQISRMRGERFTSAPPRIHKDYVQRILGLIIFLKANINRYYELSNSFPRSPIYTTRYLGLKIRSLDLHDSFFRFALYTSTERILSRERIEFIEETNFAIWENPYEQCKSW